MDDHDDCYFDSSDDEDIISSSKYISSDEDDEKFIATLKSTKNSKRVMNRDDEKDDFEREMASELSLTMQHLVASFVKKKPESSNSEKRNSQELNDRIRDKKKDPEETSEFYDDIYFDSDESETEVAEDISNISRTRRKKEKRRILSNDELFYDPTLDDQDQEWVDRKRRSYQLKKKRHNNETGMPSLPQPLPQSDAVLNCPACLTTLCMDCQRHEIYHNQYRAMFVFNCNVDMSERLKFPTKGQKKKNFLRNKRKNRDKQQLLQEDAQSSLVSCGVPPVQPDCDATPQELVQVDEMEDQETAHRKNDGGHSIASTTKDGTGADSIDKPSSTPKEPFFESSTENEVFYPVTCKICNTKVAVYDMDEVYHFFNIITSY